ncbi:MAG TPA: hypothetical protein VFY00_08320 [Arenimonas sp.]|nr:hypothetical protein [Arenimonas sp.]
MPSLDDFLVLAELDDPAAIAPLYRRAWGAEPPAFEFHAAALHRRGDGRLQPLSYLHLWLREDTCLLGGACTDGPAIAAMPADQRERLRAAGGAMLQVTRFAIARYGDRCEGFFGHCGDNRSWAVLARAGFEPTPHPNRIAHWHRPLAEARKRALVQRVLDFGVF